MIQILCMSQILTYMIATQNCVRLRVEKVIIYHKRRIQVVYRLQRHPDCPKSHHTLFHKSHLCRLQPSPWLVHPCRSKCHHSHRDCNNFESHQLLEAWHHLQHKRLMEERRTSIDNNFNFSCIWIWSWKWICAANVHPLISTSKTSFKLCTSLLNAHSMQTFQNLH